MTPTAADLAYRVVIVAFLAIAIILAAVKVCHAAFHELPHVADGNNIAPAPYWRFGSMGVYRALDVEAGVACYVLSGGGNTPTISCASYRLLTVAPEAPNGP